MTEVRLSLVKGPSTAAFWEYHEKLHSGMPLNIVMAASKAFQHCSIYLDRVPFRETNKAQCQMIETKLSHWRESIREERNTNFLQPDLPLGNCRK
jgi:hypothetical protein